MAANNNKSVKLKINFLIYQPKYMLWVLKRTVSMILFCLYGPMFVMHTLAGVVDGILQIEITGEIVRVSLTNK